MKTTTLAAALVAASALVFVRPTFAQTVMGDTAESGAAVAPSFEEPWGDGVSSSDGPALAPAPESPVAPEAGSMYVPPPPVGLIERPGLTPISPNSPALLPSTSMPEAGGGFHSFGGGFHGSIR